MVWLFDSHPECESPFKGIALFKNLISFRDELPHLHDPTRIGLRSNIHLARSPVTFNLESGLRLRELPAYQLCELPAAIRHRAIKDLPMVVTDSSK